MSKLIIFFSFFCTVCYAQGVTDSTRVALFIGSDTLFANSKSEVLVPLYCINRTHSNLLLYGIQSNIQRIHFKPIEAICSGKGMGGGIMVFIYNGLGELQHAHWSMHDDKNHPVSADRKGFEELMQRYQQEYLEGTKVVNRNDTTFFNIQFSLDSYELDPGSYSLNFVYFAGDALRPITVGNQQIEADRKRYYAEVFQGCATSNTVSLIIK